MCGASAAHPHTSRGSCAVDSSAARPRSTVPINTYTASARTPVHASAQPRSAQSCGRIAIPPDAAAALPLPTAVLPPWPPPPLRSTTVAICVNSSGCATPDAAKPHAMFARSCTL